MKHGSLFLLFAVFAECAMGCSSGSDAGVAAEPSSPGSGSIAGAIDGRTFAAIHGAWHIGKPDDAAQTRVIHLFDAPIKCTEISKTGWDTTIANGTGTFEIKLIGTAAGTYGVAPDRRPGKGQADVFYTLSSTSGTPSEIAATGGKVVVEAIADSGPAKGSYDLVFASGSVSGTFEAQFCADGREP